ncbi:hypothetical protein LTR62_004393 [Meristemomyces frigidus]|uniref:FYVE-type domain-containing protein n=1 Tax=Meristemomyces frigidus TaxID=1508187 RepID=A0AAN7YRE2_9PEZI|nr:hypothetical protein LTR62_004393 [Meristemomyces frigidus]
MASRKSLGGGRVLGSGKGLAPPASTSKQHPTNNAGLLSPSESSVSLNSQTSGTPVSLDNEDITSRVALDEHASAQAAAAASSRMVCPICTEEMMTLLQLNRHIDDNHANLQNTEQDEAKDWFKQQMVKAKKFQPLQILNQKLRGLEVFESNNDSPPASSSITTPPQTSRGASPAPTRPPEAVSEPDDIISKSHWQRPSGVDPRRTVDKQNLEISRLETRLTRLTQLLADPPPPETTQSTLWGAFASSKNHIRTLEQSIVAWEDDAEVGECPFCQQPFQYSLRRHHCRTCGRVVCGDPTTACSTEIGLDVDTKKAMGKVAMDVRLCKDCQRTIFSKADFARELAAPTADQRYYHNLLQFEQGIRLLLPRFQRLLVALQDPNKPPSPSQLADASKVRMRLTDAFTKYDAAARRIRDLPTESATQQKLQTAIYQQSMSFLHIHMLPLKSLPKIMRHATKTASAKETQTTAGKSQSSLAANRFNDIANGGTRPSSSRTSSVSTAQLTALEAEEKEVRERLMVLEEQKFLLSNMIADANKRRKFDELSALAQSVEDLSREIDQVQGQLGQMDFAGAYKAGIGVIK